MQVCQGKESARTKMQLTPLIKVVEIYEHSVQGRDCNSHHLNNVNGPTERLGLLSDY